MQGLKEETHETHEMQTPVAVFRALETGKDGLVPVECLFLDRVDSTSEVRAQNR